MYRLKGELDAEQNEDLIRRLQAEADKLKKLAHRYPYRDFSVDPDSRHCFVFRVSDYPYTVSVLFTLDKDSERGVSQPDKWHLSIVHRGTQEVIPDGVAQMIVELFFPEGGYYETRIDQHPSRHYWKDIV